MSSTKETEPASDPRKRVSALDVRPSVARIIADSDGNLDEKKAVAALSQTRDTNKHLWIGGFVLVGVVFFLIAANIGISVAVARLTRQLNVDPVTGIASIPGGGDVVMKTSIVRNKEYNVGFHSIPTEDLSIVEVVQFVDGDLSFDVKGYARMSNETILLVEGGALTFDIMGLKNITGEAPTQMMLSIAADINNDDESLLTNDENTLNNSSAVDENDGTGSSAEEGVRRLSRHPRRTPRGSEDLQPVDSIDMASNNPTIKLEDWKQRANRLALQGVRDHNSAIATCRTTFRGFVGHCQYPRGTGSCDPNDGEMGPHKVGPHGCCGPNGGGNSCPLGLWFCHEITGSCGESYSHRYGSTTEYDYCTTPPPA